MAPARTDRARSSGRLQNILPDSTTWIEVFQPPVCWPADELSGCRPRPPAHYRLIMRNWFPGGSLQRPCLGFVVKHCHSGCFAEIASAGVNAEKHDGLVMVCLCRPARVIEPVVTGSCQDHVKSFSDSLQSFGPK